MDLMSAVMLSTSNGDGDTMILGSYRGSHALEVYNMRMMRRSRVIAWQGSGEKSCLGSNFVEVFDSGSSEVLIFQLG